MTPRSHPSPVESYLVRLDVQGAPVEGQLEMPAEPRGIVLLAPGGQSPRNSMVAQWLREDVGVGTLLVDLLAGDTEQLASRFVAVCDWLTRGTRTRGLPIGLLGARTAAPAALVAAADRPDDVAAVVSRGGGHGLADDILARVRAPTLLIVGDVDPAVVDISRKAADAISSTHDLAIIHGAGHLVDDPEQLGEASRCAARWFDRHLPVLESRDEPRG